MLPVPADSNNPRDCSPRDSGALCREVRALSRRIQPTCNHPILDRRLRWAERECFSTSYDDDRPFIVLTETKLSKRHIPVWARYSPLRTRVEAHANTLSP